MHHVFKLKNNHLNNCDNDFFHNREALPQRSSLFLLPFHQSPRPLSWSRSLHHLLQAAVQLDRHGSRGLQRRLLLQPGVLPGHHQVRPAAPRRGGLDPAGQRRVRGLVAVGVARTLQHRLLGGRERPVDPVPGAGRGGLPGRGDRPVPAGPLGPQPGPRDHLEDGAAQEPLRELLCGVRRPLRRGQPQEERRQAGVRVGHAHPHADGARDALCEPLQLHGAGRLQPPGGRAVRVGQRTPGHIRRQVGLRRPLTGEGRRTKYFEYFCIQKYRKKIFYDFKGWIVDQFTGMLYC